MWHKTDGILTYNRAIHNRVDDSVCTVINNIVRVNRRSRGYAPQPIITQLYTEGIFAAGAELANSFCIGKDYQAITSQYLGDLKNLETLNFYEETYQRFVQLFRFKPELIVSDLHPDYLSTRFAEQLAEKFRVPCLKTQHHHAHLASAMITQNLDEKIIGVSFDGLGAGIDGNIWGAEFMLADLADFERLYHFEYVQMPGGDRASKEPWRMAISYLYRTFGDDLLKLNIPVLKNIETSKIQALLQVLKKNINTTMVSSAGRLFDAVASIIGVADYNTFQAEAPMRLESVLDEAESGFYEFEIRNESISFQSLIKQIVADYEQGISISVISGKFHNTIIEIVEYICLMISAKYAINKVVLSGGTFMNSYLVEKIEKRLNSKGLEVYAPSGIPVNDQGIALGQLAIAAKRRSLGLIKGSKHA
jgi:hydrogenase maturation protein HypF